jgi:hypothetical protein
MERLRKFFLLPATERLLLARALAFLVTIRFALWLIPFRTLRRALAKLVQIPTSPVQNRFSAERVAWAVQATSRYVPRATCLTQALALHILLKRAGLQSRIRIGVAKNEQFESHAWVESQGKVVIGDCGLERYTPIMLWD